MQVMYATFGERTAKLALPNPDAFVLPGIRWGSFDELLTPAYWRGQAWQHAQIGTYDKLRLGRTLSEEVAACLLGGFGMRAELGVAAFDRLQRYGLLEPQSTQEQIECALASPFFICGKLRRYRFPRQKARYLAACLPRLSEFADIQEDITLRNALATLQGIGPKTASWIVRNYFASDAVAVLDVHIVRAATHIGLFPIESVRRRNYYAMETAFLGFARALDTRAAMLDALMWDYMRRLQTSP